MVRFCENIVNVIEYIHFEIILEGDSKFNVLRKVTHNRFGLGGGFGIAYRQIDLKLTG